MTENFTLNKIPFSGDLASDLVFDDLSLFVRGVLDSHSGTAIQAVLLDLEKLLAKRSEELGGYRIKYEDLVTQLQLGIVSFLPNAQMQVVLKGKLWDCYKGDINLVKEFSYKFDPIFTQVNYEDLSNILISIEANQEVIGTVSIETPDGKAAAPSIANWLKDYKTIITADNGPLNVATYFSKRPTAFKLAENDKAFLKYVLNFYDWLRFRASKTSTMEFESSSSSPVPTPVPRSIPPAPVATKPIQPLVAPKPALAPVSNSYPESASAPFVAPHGQDLEALKLRIEQSRAAVLRPQKPVVPLAPVPPMLKMTPEEIKRETTTPELPTHGVPPAPVVKPLIIPPAIMTRPVFVPPPVPKSVMPPPAPRPAVPPAAPKAPEPVRPPMPAAPKLSLSSLSDIKVIEDLKKIGVENLRQGSLPGQAQAIKSKIVSLAQLNNLVPYYAVIAFEASPLFKLYLNHGTTRVQGQPASDNLNQAEFEAIADLRKEIERL